ncbi:MAG: putative DNA binding domain-containing protein [Thermoleophilia bacterium]|nr:putative DNA binding domain-containing protein [Thermoleophilia bacterium]
MTDEEIQRLIKSLQASGDDGQHVEAKAARGSMPSSVRDTLSAFANSSGGGVILLGVDERKGFTATGVVDAGAMQRRLVEIARDDMTPPLEPVVTVHDIAGAMVVACRVEEVPADAKPCFHRGDGQLNGSFRRVGDRDVRLNSAQVQALMASRGQPRWDLAPVDVASVDDLDRAGVDAYLDRLRDRNPRVFGTSSADDALARTNVLVRDDAGELRPAVGGILALGTYPQQFFPQLNVSIVAYPTVSGDPVDGVRFVENRRVDGPIPDLLLTTLKALLRTLRSQAVIDATGGRSERPEYPVEALREAIANALVHRDLSPSALGTQVAIEIYPDRLEITNPGGLHGGVSVDTLGENGISSSRNANLVRLLEDTKAADGRLVIENRASGIRTMTAALRSAGLAPPEFEDHISHFTVRFRNATLLDQDAIDWLGAIDADHLASDQRAALVMLRRGTMLTNESYRRSSGIDSRVATAHLRQLVDEGFAVTEGCGRWMRYRIAERIGRSAGSESLPDAASRVLAAIHGETTRADIELATGFKRPTVIKWLNELERRGLIAATAPPRSKLRRYRRIESPTKLF